MSELPKNLRVKRRHIDAKVDKTIDINVSVAVFVRDNVLTRDEQNCLVQELTSRIMRDLPGLPYASVPLCDVKVSR